MADIAKYFPDLLKEIKQFKELAVAENLELGFLSAELENVMNDQFISTALNTGVSRREEMLNIKPMSTDTLQERKFRLMAKYNEDVPYTWRKLEEVLTTLCDETGYRIEYSRGEYSLVVKLELTNKKNEITVRDLLERITPVNLLLTVELLYNQWQTLEHITWGEAEVFTWGDLREEVIRNG